MKRSSKEAVMPRHQYTAKKPKNMKYTVSRLLKYLGTQKLAFAAAGFLPHTDAERDRVLRRAER